MERLNTILATLEGLKIQADVALNSNGDNGKINRIKLKEAHQKMNPRSLQDEILKSYMKEKNIASYPSIDLNDFQEYFLLKK